MEKIKFYTKPTISSTPELKMVIDVSGNVGIGESNPTKALEVVGDISFNGDLYQNGELFATGGVSSGEDVSFNNVDISNVLNVNSQITIGEEMESSINFTTSAQTKIVASDGAANDQFGNSVAISGNYAIVGAYADDDKGSASGSAYIFNVNTGAELHHLLASDGAADDWFGHSVAISGNYAIVGAPNDDDNLSNSGSAYIFNVQTGAELHKLTASDGAGGDYFGYSVAMSGNYAIVGAYADDDNGSASGSAYIYNVQTGAELHKLTANDGAMNDYFGRSVAISGNYAIVGAFLDDDNGSASGSAYIYNVTTGAELHKLVASDGAASDQLGESVGIDGNYAIVGAIYDDDNGSSSGSAYIYNVQTGAELHKLTASDAAESDYFGYYVAISGNYAIVGAKYDDDNGTNSGSAYIFNVTTGAELCKLTANDAGGADEFGRSVAISGNYAIVGANKDDDNGSASGSAYIFTGTLISPDTNALNVNGDGLFSGTVTSNGSVLSSDDRVKHNEKPITNALSIISKLTPKHYFKTKNTLYDPTHNFLLNDQNQPLSTSGTPLLLNKDYTIETGIIAQELQTIPELEFTVQNTTPLGVDYNSIHCTHIAATKELHQLVESQQQEITNLKQENATLTQRLQTIEQHLGI
jgi:esterase/lipase superfamily enzyme